MGVVKGLYSLDGLSDPGSALSNVAFPPQTRQCQARTNQTIQGLQLDDDDDDDDCKLDALFDWVVADDSIR